jgi:hypothetical protein
MTLTHLAPCDCAVSTALTAVCKLINADLITAVLGPVVKLLEHPKELVRDASWAVVWDGAAWSSCT